MSWLCTCGTGNLVEEYPPEFCPVCDYPLWDHFGMVCDMMEIGERENAEQWTSEQSRAFFDKEFGRIDYSGYH